MLGMLSFLWLLSAVAFVSAVAFAIVRAVKKQSKKPFIIMAIVSFVLAIGLTMPISSLYVPNEQTGNATVSESFADTDTPDSESAADVALGESGIDINTEPFTETATASMESAADTEKAEREQAEKEVKEKAEKEAREKAKKEKAEREAKEKAEREQAEKEKAEREAKEKAENEKNEKNSVKKMAERTLNNAKINECPVMNGSKTERIGTYGRIIMSKDDMKMLTSKQLFKYALNVIDPLQGNYNWFTIKMNDGTGMVFTGCSYFSFDYGMLDRDGTIKTHLGSGFVNDNMDDYEYFTIEEIEEME